MDPGTPKIIGIEDFEPHIGAEAVDRIARKAERLRGVSVANVSSTYYGGGVAEILSSETLLMNSLGLSVGWRVIQGSPDFFSITKKMHNALQGAAINLSELKMQIYEEVIAENSVRNHLRHDVVIVHDPQPLAMIRHYRKRGPWIWRCHVDLTEPNRELLAYLRPFIREYDAVVLTLEEYRQRGLGTPQVFSLPAIDPFTIKNRDLSDAEIRDRLGHYGIPDDLPLVVQVSRFDRWKDPEGVIDAFKLARRSVDATLVLLGNVATDDPEGSKVYESLLGKQEERIIILSVQDTALVNALQRRAAVVLQKSLREGFGLTVTEALWKGTPVIGGDVGGIRRQIRNGGNGYLVGSVEQAARRLVELLRNPSLRERMGRSGRETVKRRFLISRTVEEYLDLIASFETNFRLRTGKRGRLPGSRGRP